MQYAVRSVQYAVCSTQYAACSMQHAACRMQHAGCSRQHVKIQTYNDRLREMRVLTWAEIGVEELAVELAEERSVASDE